MPKVKKVTEKKTTSKKKLKEYFKVSDEIIFDVVDKLKKKKDIEVDLVTCFEIKVTWLASKYTKEDIEKLIK